MVKDYLLYQFNERGDSSGKLIAIEDSDIPFEIKRIFYIYGTLSESVRGRHANKNSEFVLICVSGSCKVKLFDGAKEETVILDRPNLGLYIPKMIWKDMYDFTDDAVLLALSNCYYDSEEYIRNIDDYVQLLNNSRGGGYRILIVTAFYALRGVYVY